MCSLDLRSSIKACVVKFKELNDLILPLRMLSFLKSRPVREKNVNLC